MRYSYKMITLITKLKLLEIKINSLNKHEKKLTNKLIRINHQSQIYENKLKSLKNSI